MKQPPIPFEHVLSSPSTDKRLDILRSIGQAGSISQAARANDVSYKAAWQAIETLSNLAGAPLIEKAVGGSGGGGARLTPAGLQVLEAADVLSQARQTALEQLRDRQNSGNLNLQGLASVSLRTSMRNQLPCLVQSIENTTLGVRIRMLLDDGQTLASRITKESLELLDLQVGMPVIAMCKATAVKIAPTIVALGDINLLSGTIARRVGLAKDGQVSLALSGTLQLAGFAEPSSLLKLRQKAQAAIDESAIVIALGT